MRETVIVIPETVIDIDLDEVTVNVIGLEDE
jgi:hypothetical protein